MSLRLRLVLSLACALSLAMAAGCALAGLRAASSVRTEMQAALTVARQTAASALAANDPDAARKLVATFDNNRHVRARLADAAGHDLAASRLARPRMPVPHWLVAALDPVLPPVTLALPGGGTITLQADAANEVGEVRDQAIDGLWTMAVFFGLTLALLFWSLGRALRPLTRLAAGFARLGAGDTAARVAPHGPPELAALAAGFNRMAAQLAEMEAQNRRLQEQLLTLQEEERADLARDLHDEIGPHLFAAAIDAATLRDRCSADAVAAERIEAIGQAVAHMQRHIRSILGRLRPLSFGAVGLAEAVANVAAFWRSRDPAIAITLDLPPHDDSLSEAARATIGRVVQESLCNAVRHAHPSSIAISVTREHAADGRQDWVVQVADDGVGLAAGPAPGFGMLGMRERVAAQGGSLVVRQSEAGRGLCVVARLPAS
jgi:two-component system sensor histidine kinase UhpB